jgi:hypothetical protein
LRPAAVVHVALTMPPITVHKTVAAIIERSGEVVVALGGVLDLIEGEDGRFRLEERFIKSMADVGRRRGVRARGIDGRRLGQSEQ